MSAPDASDRRGAPIFGLAGAVTCLAGALKADPQETGGATRPGKRSLMRRRFLSTAGRGSPLRCHGILYMRKGAGNGICCME